VPLEERIAVVDAIGIVDATYAELTTVAIRRSPAGSTRRSRSAQPWPTWAPVGRDSLFFARRGHDVAAYDFCRNARAKVGRQARRQGLPIEPRLLILNELRSVLVAGAELAREHRHLYARQLVGCLDDAGRENLWTLARMAARGRGKLFLEFSAVSDHPDATDPLPAGLVRRLDPAAVRREIEASGGRVLLDELGPGVDMLDQYDPSVCRMRVTFRRPGPQKRRAA